MSTTNADSNTQANSTFSRGSHHAQVERLRLREASRRRLIVGVGMLSLLAVALLGIALADYFLELSGGRRLLLWSGMVIGLLVVLRLTRPWRRFASTDAVVAAENAAPELGQRLRTSHDYATAPSTVAPAHPQLLQALEAQTENRVATLELPQLGSLWPVAALSALVVALAGSWMIALLLVPQWSVATARLAFLPLHYSSVTVDPLPETIEQGEDLPISLRVDGRPVKRANAYYRAVGQTQWTPVPMQSSDGSELVGALSSTITDVQDDLEVRIEAGEYSSSIHQVAVKVPIVLQHWNATVVPPNYTGLSEQQGPLETLSIPEGSQVRIEAEYSRSPSTVEATLSTNAERRLDAEIVDGTVRFSFVAGGEPIELVAKATTGDGMIDESSVRIEVIPDREPLVRFTSPAKDSEAIATAELEFVPEATDDYSLTSVGVRYRIDNGEEQTLWESKPGDSSQEIRTSVRMALEQMNVSYPQAITYYAYAIDNRSDHPQRVTSELRFVDIRPFDRSYEFVDGQCNSNCQGECLSLEKLIKQQREILGRTFAASHQSAPVAAIAKKLSSQQQTLADQTRQLTVALEQKVGPMPSLGVAATEMDHATEELSQVELSPAQTHEEDALANLIAARQNLRKILKQSNSQSQACKSVDKQQMDKLRKPESKQQQQEQDQQQKLAEVRKQLEEMANKQESFCQSAKACSQPSPQSSGKSSAKQLAAEQRSAASSAEQLKQQLEKEPFGDLAPKRLAEVADSIRSSAETLKDGSENEDSVAKAEDAARALRDLSEHLRRRHLPDFEDKLDTARRQAERIAAQQQELNEAVASTERANQPDPIGDKPAAGQADITKLGQQQRELASDTEELSDLVDQLMADSADQQWQIQKSLLQGTPSTAPQRASADMRQAAKALGEERADDAARAGERAADTLRSFAGDLQRLHEMLGPARLEQLVEAERQVAKIRKQLDRQRRPAEQARALAQVSELAQSVRQMSQGDSELRTAVSRLSDAAATGFVRRTSDQRKEEHVDSAALNQSSTSVVEGLREVGVVLQQRIQEAILSGALQQNDVAVPPEYVEIVDEYYRVLSEDIE
jgi:hypothetical protein